MNKDEHIYSEYCCYFESKNQYKKDISIDQNKNGYCIIEDRKKRDPWSRDRELQPIGRTEVLEYIMSKYNVRVKSYYMWLEKENKKISDIHPGADGKTSEITHHYHLFQGRNPEVGYVYLY
jgi:iron-sulfur cluster repair protein YtfE (RIC family)